MSFQGQVFFRKFFFWKSYIKYFKKISWKYFFEKNFSFSVNDVFVFSNLNFVYEIEICEKIKPKIKILIPSDFSKLVQDSKNTVY